MADKAPKNIRNPSLHFYRKKRRRSKVYSSLHLKNELDTYQNRNLNVVKIRMGRKDVEPMVAF